MSLTVLLSMIVSGVAQGLFIAYGNEPEAYYGFVASAYLIVVIAHRDNIARLAAGTERVIGRPASAAANPSRDTAAEPDPIRAT